MEKLGLYLARFCIVSSFLFCAWMILSILSILVTFIIDAKVETF